MNREIPLAKHVASVCYSTTTYSAWIGARHMNTRHIIKRDGSRQSFDAVRITRAIRLAGAATGEFGADAAAVLAARATAALSERCEPGMPTVEQVQDIVERVLIDAGHLVTARAYIVYREQHKRLRQDRKTLIDVEQSIDEYLDRRDWRVNANANQGYSLGGLILNTAGKVTANYWLSHVYPPQIGAAHREADIHIHDLDMLSGY